MADICMTERGLRTVSVDWVLLFVSIGPPGCSSWRLVITLQETRQGLGAKDSVNHSGRFAAKIDFRLMQPATQRQLNRLNVLPGVKVVHDVMSILRSRYGQIGLLAAVGIAVTQLPVDEVQAWAMPHSQTFVFDAIAKEAQGLQREVLPGVRLTDIRQEGDTVVFSKFGGTELKYNGEEYLLLSQRDILAIIEK